MSHTGLFHKVASWRVWAIRSQFLAQCTSFRLRSRPRVPDRASASLMQVRCRSSSARRTRSCVVGAWTREVPMLYDHQVDGMEKALRDDPNAHQPLLRRWLADCGHGFPATMLRRDDIRINIVATALAQ